LEIGDGIGAIALSENKGDRSLRFDMGKAIALLVVWAIALFSKHFGTGMDGEGLIVIALFFVKAIAIVTRFFLILLAPQLPYLGHKNKLRPRNRCLWVKLVSQAS
jgi:hypothetical protein